MQRVQDHKHFQLACKAVAAERRSNAYKKFIDQGDHYADHVTEADKIETLNSDLKAIEPLERYEITNATHWQAVNRVLTGKTIAILGDVA